MREPIVCHVSIKYILQFTCIVDTSELKVIRYATVLKTDVTCKLWLQWPRLCTLVGTRVISLAVKPEIVGVAGANMQWGHFVCPSSSQKRQSTAFYLILKSAWGLSSPSKQVGRSSTSCRKGAKFGVEKVNRCQNICNRVTHVENGKNFEKRAQSSMG